MALIVGSSLDKMFQSFKTSIENQLYSNVLKVYDELKCNDTYTPRYKEISEADIDKMRIQLNEQYLKTIIKVHLKLIENDSSWIIAVQFCTILFPSNGGIYGNQSSKTCICYINNCGTITEYNEFDYHYMGKSWINFDSIKINNPDSCLPDALIDELITAIGHPDVGQRPGLQGDQLSQIKNLYSISNAYKSMLKYRQKYNGDILTLRNENERLKARLAELEAPPSTDDLLGTEKTVDVEDSTII